MHKCCFGAPASLPLAEQVLSQSKRDLLVCQTHFTPVNPC